MTLSEFEQALISASSLTLLKRILSQYLQQYGINSFAFTYYSYYPKSIHKLKYHFSSAEYELWHQHYIDQGYEDTDTTLDDVYQSVLPIFWDVKAQLKTARSQREKKMREDSLKYGVEKGLSIPIHGPEEDFAIILLLQMRGENWLEKSMHVKHELLSAAYLYYQYLQPFFLKDTAEHPIYQLSERETQCLMLLAKQFSLQAMAKELKLTERTVNYHIQRLNKKLGTKNKYQTVIKAIKKGLLK